MFKRATFSIGERQVLEFEFVFVFALALGRQQVVPEHNCVRLKLQRAFSFHLHASFHFIFHCNSFVIVLLCSKAAAGRTQID